MKQALVTVFIIIVCLIGLWLVIGSTGVAIGLGVITLTIIVFAAFALGSLWTGKTLKDGVRLANERAIANDQYDAVKIKATADLIREVIKMKGESLSPPSGFPALPFSRPEPVEGSFTIAGLEEIDEISGELNKEDIG